MMPNVLIKFESNVHKNVVEESNVAEHVVEDGNQMDMDEVQPSKFLIGP